MATDKEMLKDGGDGGVMVGEDGCKYTVVFGLG